MNETLKWFRGLGYTKQDEDGYIYESSSKEETEFAKVLASASTIHLYEVAAHEENLDNLEAETL